MPTIHGTVTFNPPATGGGTLVLRRLGVVPKTNNTNAIEVDTPSSPGTTTLRVQSAIVSATGTGTGIHRTGFPTTGSITVDARHVTVAGSSNAAGGDSFTVTFHDSIVSGSGGVTAGNNNLIPSGGPLFADESNRDSDAYLHLSADAGAALDNGGSLDSVETGSPAAGASADVDGQGRPAPGGAVDRGADEFYDSPPGAPAISGTQFAYVGDPVALTAGASDPDPGGSVTGYTWDWGDGSASEPASGSPSSNQHVYSQPGTYFVTVSATDNNGQTGGAGQLGVVVFARPVVGSQPLPRLGSGAAGADAAPPKVSITTPRPGQRLRLRVGRAVPSLRGRVSDDTGVRSVELALSRKRGSACQWFDGRRLFRTGSCARPRWFRARVEDFAWRYSFPRGVRPSLGTYRLAARATDILGNRSAAASVATRTAATFRFVR